MRTVIPEYMYKAKGKVVTEGGLCSAGSEGCKRRDAKDLCVYAGLDLFQAKGILEHLGERQKA
ncbi:hypothetical protein I79_020945 [Cricetulus griseus]|uniref:Uncharacterized protein n=1 Tax=Cricetulus griseus TaxID=10029 RepID=G3IBC5_CRIGR|nr:hypothetical protein I79_020945 [Cricetulus griseus]